MNIIAVVAVQFLSAGATQAHRSTAGSVTLVFWGDQSFNGTGAVCSFDPSGAGASSAGASAGSTDVGASSAGALLGSMGLVVSSAGRGRGSGIDDIARDWLR